MAQWAVRWSANLAVPGSVFAGGGNLFKLKRGSIAHGLLLPPSHRPDMTEIVEKDI